MPMLSIMDGKGHSQLDWDPEDEQSVKNAQKAFEDLSAKGYRFWLITEKGNPKGAPIRKFKVAEGRMIFSIAEAGVEKDVEPRAKKDEVVAAPKTRGG